MSRIGPATGMLASVTSVAEAGMALAAGADIIDLKDPSSGALGALPLRVIVDVVRCIGGRRPVSATVGDLVDGTPEHLGRAVDAVSATGVTYVKVGFFPGLDAKTFCSTLGRASNRGAGIVAVLFADAGWPVELPARLGTTGLAGVMLDTAQKSGRSLRDCLTDTAIFDFLQEAQSLGLITGLAGSLSLEDIPYLLPMAPNYLGFRGALCHGGDRQLGLAAEALAGVRGAIVEGHPVRQKAAH